MWSPCQSSVTCWAQVGACCFGMQPNLVFECEHETRLILNPWSKTCAQQALYEAVMPSDIKRKASHLIRHSMRYLLILI